MPRGSCLSSLWVSLILLCFFPLTASRCLWISVMFSGPNYAWTCWGRGLYDYLTGTLSYNSSGLEECSASLLAPFTSLVPPPRQSAMPAKWCRLAPTRLRALPHHPLQMGSERRLIIIGAGGMEVKTKGFFGFVFQKNFKIVYVKLSWTFKILTVKWIINYMIKPIIKYPSQGLSNFHYFVIHFQLSTPIIPVVF